MKKKLFFIAGFAILFAGCHTNDKNLGTADPTQHDSSTAAISEKPDTDMNNETAKPADDMQCSETEHFIMYYYEEDKDCLQDLNIGLESAYSQVTTDLDCPLEYKVDVTVYPDITSLHIAIGYSGGGAAANYITAATIGKHIFILSPMNPGPVRTYEHMVNSSTRHEFTHVVINEITHSRTWPNDVPRWLNEGIACYEGGPPMPESMMKQQISSGVVNDRIPTFDDMASYGEDYITKGGYFFALPAGKFFIETYGLSKVKQLLISPDDYVKIFGKTEKELWDEWVEYLKANYA